MDYDFTTDGCSGGISWAWRKITGKAPPWEGICVEHDKIYWVGGTIEQRRAADRQLMSALTLAGHPILAFVFWIGVRFGGHPLLPTPWRWGYGWKYPRGYTKQTIN
jgi:hypothetical protein